MFLYSFLEQRSPTAADKWLSQTKELGEVGVILSHGGGLLTTYRKSTAQNISRSRYLPISAAATLGRLPKGNESNRLERILKMQPCGSCPEGVTPTSSPLKVEKTVWRTQTGWEKWPWLIWVSVDSQCHISPTTGSSSSLILTRLLSSKQEPNDGDFQSHLFLINMIMSWLLNNAPNNAKFIFFRM